MNNPFLFACGVPRSGTTLLQRMLDSHPDLAVANDTHFIPRALEATDKSLVLDATRGFPLPLTPELISNVWSYHRFERLKFNQQEFEEIVSQSTTYQQLVAAIYDLYARKSNKILAGEKTPDYVRRLSLLNGMFPSARFIHLVRDGRNVALSLLQWATPMKGPGRLALWNDNPVAVCALWWRWMVMESQKQKRNISVLRYAQVHYEDLVRDPAETLQRVCEFLDLKFSPLMLQYHRGKTKIKNNLSAKSAWLAPQPGLRNWLREMSRDDIELFEALAGDALLTFGYRLHCDSYSEKTLSTAAGCENWWEKNFLPKQNGSVVGSYASQNSYSAKTDLALDPK